MNSSAERIEALLHPKNIVILGATDRPGNWPARVWRNLKRHEFPHPVYPFNPARESVWDTRCYRSFAELPEPPDHLVLLIPAAAVPDALRDGAAAGARSATVMTSGFGELSDAQSAALDARLRAVIAETGIAVTGPNCLGNMYAPSRLMTMPDDRPQKAVAGPVAIIGQSGGIPMAIKRTLEERGIQTGAIITSGNEAGLTTADFLAYFARDPNVRVIVSYLEAVRDAGAFLAACRTARKAGKPVIVVKLGASEEGREAALAHTGRLAGSMDAFDAVAGAAGCMRARNLDQLVELVEYCAITFSGGLRGLLLDAAAAQGLSFGPLAKATRARLKKIFTVGSVVGNPIDAGFAALTSQDAYLECVRALMDDPGVDVVLLQEELPRAPGTERKESNLRAVNALVTGADKPVCYVTMISHGMTDYSRALRAELGNLTFLQEPDKAVGAVRAIVDYAEAARRPAPKKAVSPKSARVALGKALSRGGKVLNEPESKALLKAYGIAAPKEAVAHSPREAESIARRVGFPVVAKAVSAALAHKSDAGGVILNLGSAAEVRAAYAKIAKKFGKKLEGVLIAEQVSGGLELVVGLHRDPEMGPVILFGSGGVNLELHRDVALAGVPLDQGAAEALIGRTKVSKLIDGYRGSPKLDRTALVKTLIALSQLAADAGPRIQSIDINPFLLRRKGGVALDALVVLA